jgi:hypothetical protein
VLEGFDGGCRKGAEVMLLPKLRDVADAYTKTVMVERKFDL